MKFNSNPGLLEVGDYVTTHYLMDARDIVRCITDIQDGLCDSGLLVSVDAGSPCGRCGRYFSEAIQLVDASWFMPVPAPDDNCDGHRETDAAGNRL